MRHLKRLDRVFSEIPVFFVTACSHERKPVLVRPGVPEILCEEWKKAVELHGWKVGRYVVMPDHVHFFCLATNAAKPLINFMGRWKEWTAKRSSNELGIDPPFWQAEFFDHVLRKEESYGQKTEYMFLNPVRAGLVEHAEAWPWKGEIHNLTQAA